ncbi:MAG: Asp-tRNA(Asn)/Glu-tRNA(Gln) amidotransferase subunit GatA [Planctomycetaceae bacterium]
MATAATLLQQLASGETSSAALVSQALDRIKTRDGEVQAFLAVDRDGALEQAQAIDARRQRGEPLGPLAGLPIALKDVMCVRGWKTTCASRMLENFSPPYDADVVARLRRADAVLIGRTNMDEFAMGSSSEASAFQVTRNPWDRNRIPGGSSGGSAAAVAARMVPLSLGSDTGGSIRQPASFCGIVGLKPTYGRVSRRGLVAYASSLDQIGPFATTVGDAAVLLEVIAGHDPGDSTSINCPVPAYTQTVQQPLRGLKVGVVREHYGEGLDPEVRQAVESALDIYRRQGAEVVEVSLPHQQYSVAVYYLVASSEASSNLARYDGVHYGHRTEQKLGLADMYSASRGEAFGSEVKRRIMLGTYALSSGYYDAYYNKALKVRRLIRQDFDRAFEQVDVIASPVAPQPAYRLGEFAADPLAMYLSDIYTLSANLAGLPGVSIPCGLSTGGLPIGLQLLARPFDEERLLRAARMHEQATDWHTRTPALLQR